MSQAEDWSGLTVLVAEDEEFSRRLTATLLKTLGVGSVIEVENGRLALDRLIDGGAGVDLLVADIDMPRIDGLTLAQKIRKGDEGAPRSLPIIILTGSVQEPYKQAADLRGIASFLEKPPSSESLRAAIATAISGGSPA